MMRTLHAALRLALLGLLLAGPAFAQNVREIQVRSRDGTMLEREVVEAFVSVREGDRLTRDGLARDVRALEQSGRFSFVAVNLDDQPDGVVVMFTIQFKPVIRRMVITGADYLGNKKVRELLELGVGDAVDDSILATKALKVKEQYQKKLFPFANLSWTISTDAASGGADVAIEVTEGDRAKVKDITFSGNDHVEAKELRKVMKQRRRHWFSWLTGSGSYNPDMLAADYPLLRDVYLDRGYLDVSFGEAEIIPVKKDKIIIHIPVTEGVLYRLGQMDLAGATLFPVTNIMAGITNRPGDVASATALRQANQAIKDYYGSRGYIDTLVNYRLDPTRTTTPGTSDQVVDVHFNVKEGHLAYIRSIGFRGNTRTKDKVMRREVTVYPGEVVNEVKIRNSERRLRNLGYYSNVAAMKEPTQDPTQYDVMFELEEQKAGQFMVGAGFSSVDNLIGFMELSHGNVDIFEWPPVGGGQKLRLRGTLGTERTDVEFNFTEPWFLDRRLSLGFSLFQRDSRYFSDDYDQVNTGGRITLGVPAGRFSRVNFIYGLEEITVKNVDETASPQIKAEEGSRLKSSFTTEYIFDTRDSPFVPTRGTRASVAGMFAGGPLAGDTDIYGFDANLAHYFPIWFDHVLSLRGMSAVVDSYGDMDEVPIFDRLFLGGARTLRGFDFREVGPKDFEGEPLGGYTMWFASAEYTIPVAKLVRLAAFYDIGMVYEETYETDWGDYNSDWGLGVRFDIPGFPLRFDYAWPLDADEFNDNSGQFQFSIGYAY